MSFFEDLSSQELEMVKQLKNDVADEVEVRR